MWGKAKSPGWNTSRGTPCTPCLPPPHPGGAPHSPPLLSTPSGQHSSEIFTSRRALNHKDRIKAGELVRGA